MKQRLFCISFYLGLAPFYYFILLFRKNNHHILKHHFRQAIAMFLVLFCIVIGFIFSFLCDGMLSDYLRKLSGTFPFDFVVSFIFIEIFLIWLVIWCICLMRAASCDTRDIPIITKIARNDKLVIISTCCAFIVVVTFLFIFVLVHLSTQPIKIQDKPAYAYMLYEDMGFYPRWVFTLGFYRIAKVAVEKWGDGSVIIAPLSRATLREALQNGRFVFISSHGCEIKKGAISFSPDWENWYGPEEAKSTGIGPRLQFVYLAACYSGQMESQWKDAFSQAEVKTFYDISMISGHIFWLWFKSPRKLRTIK